MAMSLACGSYVGNESARSIVGAGFQPKALFVFSDNTAATGDAAGCLFKSDTMGSTSAAHMGENAFISGISTLDADGFSLSSSKTANHTGKNYYWIALAGQDVVTGSYTGNGTDNRSISGVGFQPSWVILNNDSNDHVFHKMNSTGASTDSAMYFTSLGNVSNSIQALESDGFQVGVGVAAGQFVNENAVTHHYVCFKSSAAVYNTSYTGNGTDNRSISGFGFSPRFVLVKSVSVDQAVVKSESLSGDNSGGTRNNVGVLANLIQSLDSDGITIGTGSGVNTTSMTYHLIGFTATPSGPFPFFSSRLMTGGMPVGMN
jgi:hypothetical protein